MAVGASGCGSIRTIIGVRMPAWLLLVIGGEGMVTLSRNLRVSNQRFKVETGWVPTVARARSGWKRLA